MDIPNDRSLHSDPIPHGAGLIIALVCLAAYLPISFLALNTFSWGYFAGACLIVLVSYLDDMFKVGFKFRLLVHSIAAVLLILDLDTWHGITMLGNLQMGNWAYILTFIWIVWMINAYNFMDGIDGLAGLQAVTAGLSWLLLGRMLQMPALYLLGGVIASASMAFLVQNWQPAKIFMGDVGATFLGYTFAALPLLARHMASKDWDLLPIAAVLFIWFFLFDSSITLLRRLLRGVNVFAPHREHLFQRLIASGLSHRRVTVIYGVLSSVLSISVLVSVLYREEIGMAMLPVVVVLTVVLVAICWRRGVLFEPV
ncbi:MAG TPA: glycosyltransferase family 4 protein [Pyrinomonadaceae bacterium]|nr:glycosyltransferase family 4 protein [Pyrinomonadaceae bacterium]